MLSTGNIVGLWGNPAGIKRLIAKLVAEPVNVFFNSNIDDQVKLRNISMSAIWACLENGAVMPAYLTQNKDGSFNFKMQYVFGGDVVEVDVWLVNNSGDQRVKVLWAEVLERG